MSLSLGPPVPPQAAPAALSPQEKRELDRLLSGFGLEREKQGTMYHTQHLRSRPVGARLCPPLDAMLSLPRFMSMVGH